MTFELTMLALAIVLGLVHVSLQAVSATAQYGRDWNVGPRDAPQPPLQGVGGRLQRAWHNFLETFPLFAAAVLIAHVANRHSGLTVWGAGLYLGARVVYLPLYAAGIPFVRSAVWSVATVGIVLILLALL
jgi:uncharacterized MAPEG superfamily protein